MVRRHLTVDAVADHLEGLLPETAAAGAERHLRECADCSAIRNDLVAVREVLAAQPAEPMPDTVALRIETSLAEAWSDLSAGRAAASETRLDLAAANAGVAAGETRAATADLTTRSRGRQSRPRARRIIPVFAAAAGTIGVVFTAAVIGPQLINSSGDDDDGAGGLAITADRPDGQAEGERRPDDSEAMAGAEAEQPFSGELPAISVNQSGRDYTSYTLAAGVADLLAAARVQTDSALSPNVTSPGPSAVPSPTPTPLAPGAPPSASPFALAAPGQPLAPFADGGARLRACIREVAGQDVQPILVDLGTFAGEPAVVIVVPDDTDPASATAWAVDHRCGTGLPAEEITFAVVTTPHPTAAPTPTQNPDPDEPTSTTVIPHDPGTPPN